MSRLARSPRMTRCWHFLAAAGFVAALALATAPLVQAQAGTTASDDSRLRRTIKGMENVFDDVFVESRNVLVQSSEATHGVHIPEFGILFTAKVSLLDRWSHTRKMNWNWVCDDDDDDDKDRDEDREEDSARLMARQEKQYKAFKEEMIEAILAGGDNFSARLDGNQWVGIAIALEKSRYFKKNNLHELQIKARAGDLKAYADGTITEAAMKGKIVTTES